MTRYVYTGPAHGRATDRPCRSLDAVVAYINAELARGHSPTAKEIQTHMGWRYLGSARNALRSINWRGKLPAGYDRNELRLPVAYKSRRVLTMHGWEAA